MKKTKMAGGRRIVTAIAAGLIAVAIAPAYAGSAKSLGKPVANNQARYLVEYKAGNLQAIQALVSAQGGSIAFDYSSLFPGLAIDLPDNGVRALRNSGLITTIQGDVILSLHDNVQRQKDFGEEQYHRSNPVQADNNLTSASSAQKTKTANAAGISKTTSSASASSSSSSSAQGEGATPFEDGAIPEVAPSAIPAGFPGPGVFAEFVAWDRDRAQSDAVWSIAPNFGVADNGIASPVIANGSITGAGVVVGVLDTGIDYNHPDLAGNIINDCGTDGVTRDFLDGDDCSIDDTFNGHGTSVASVIASASNGIGLVGNAPEAKIRPYRVCDGGCPLSAIVGGIMQATADGVDVINMSFGGGIGGGKLFENTPDGFEASAIQAAAQADIVLVASAGNGASQKVQFPAGFAQVLAVGATNITDAPASFTNYGGWVDITGPGVNNPTATCSGCVTEAFVNELTPNANNYSANQMTNSPIAAVSNVEIEHAGNACAPLPAGSLTGKAAFIRRGSCSFAQKVFNAEAAGAVGSVVANNIPGNFFGTLGTFASTGPAVSISQSDGDALETDILAGTTTVDLGTIRRFDIGYWLISGTSFSSPTVAGVAALVRQANPNLTELEVRKILTSTAQPIGPQVIFGAGMVDAYSAVQAAMP